MLRGDKFKRKRGRPRKFPVADSCNFFKVILHQTLQEKKLKIPGKFLRKYGSRLVSPLVDLVDPNGRGWEVGITRVGDDVWFDHGWSDFVEYYSISYGYFLVFLYGGNSKFHVFIFDKSTCDIDYPSCERSSLHQNKRKQHSSVPEDFEANKKHDYRICAIGLDDDDESKDSVIPLEMLNFDHNKLQMTIRTPSGGNGERGHGYVYLEEHIEIYVTVKFGLLYSSAEKRRAINAAKTIKPKNPSFMAIMRSNIANGTMCVPAAFVNTYLSQVSGHMITLVDSHGRKWPIGMVKRKFGGFNLKDGWATFSREINLKVGDICILELIKVGGSELKVSTFRA